MPCVDIDNVSLDTRHTMVDPDVPVNKRRKHVGYPLGGVGTMIPNAIDGSPIGVRVGSYESIGLYIVSDVTGRYTSDGYVIDKLIDPPNPDPVRFCYHSPTEYAKHRRINMSSPSFQRTNEKWKDMQSYIRVNGVVDPDRWKEWKSDNNY